MKEKDCKIVRDLLPNYIEKLTSEETNQFVENHLIECEECSKIFQNMKEELNVNSEKRDSREVKYIKKYNVKLRALTVGIIIVLLIAVSVMTYYYFYMRNAYFTAASFLVDALSNKPDTFYATIEEIEDTGVVGLAIIKIQGLDVNDINHRGEYYFLLSYPTRDDEAPSVDIKFQENIIDFDQLKVGQKIAVYNYAGTSIEDNRVYLDQVSLIVVLDDEL